MQSSASRRARQLASLVLAVLVAVVGVVTLSPSADAAPTAPAAVVVPQPCAISLAYPEGQSPAKIKELYGTHYGFTMVGRYWDDPAYQGIVRVIWETTDAIACTPFLEDLRATWPWSHRGELARVGVDLEAVCGQAQLIRRFEGHQEGTPGWVSSHRSTALVAICPVPRTTW